MKSELLITHLVFEVEGQPLPKERPRHGGYKQVYTPTKTLNWERQIGWAARYAMQQAGLSIFEKSAQLGLIMQFRRKDARAVDLDNLVKAVLDGLNKVAYEDDSSITVIIATLTKKTEPFGVTVTLFDPKTFQM